MPISIKIPAGVFTEINTPILKFAFLKLRGPGIGKTILKQAHTWRTRVPSCEATVLKTVRRQRKGRKRHDKIEQRTPKYIDGRICGHSIFGNIAKAV